MYSVIVKFMKLTMGDITRTLVAVVVVCTWNVVCSLINGTEYENSVIVSSWTRTGSATQNVHINMIPGTLYDIKNSSDIHVVGLSNCNIKSMEADYTRSRLYIYDYHTAAIYSLENLKWREKFANISLKLVHDGVSKCSVRLAVDWVSNNLYWTDPLFGWIIVQSGSKENTYKILIDDDLEKPYALAVDPINKQMFWSDIGTTVKIEQASLTGTDRQTIISTGLYFPSSIDIDQSDSKLVWVDYVRDTLETASFDGTQRRVIRRISSTLFYDVAVFKGLVGVTELNNGPLTILNKNTGTILKSFTKSNEEPFVAVTLYSSHIQPTQDDRCSGYGCSDICVNNKDGPTCLCKEGYKQNQDGSKRKCSEDLGKFHRAFMWSNNSNICMMDIRSITSNTHTDSVDCFLNGTSISQFDIDMSERNVVYVDGGKDIYSAKIERNAEKQRLTSEKLEHIITGIAIDWRDENVYFCVGETKGEINLVSQQTEMFPLINTDLAYPKNLNLLPFHNIMLWISGTSGSSKLEKSNLDGSDREVLYSSTSSEAMKGLSVDYSTNTLYFIDNWYVKMCDVEGKQLTTLTPESALVSPMMVVPYKNYLIVADRAFPNNVMKVYEKKAQPVLTFKSTAINLVTLADMHVLDALLHRKKKGPCAILNGGCEQICIPVGENRMCRCEYGFELDKQNKQTCSSTALTDNFLLVTDWTHNKIYQVSLENDDVRAVDTDTYGSPIGIAFNHLTQQVIWSTNNLVHTLSLNGTGHRVILNTEVFGSHADRFAIDYPSGNIFYTANRISSIAFIGVGVISPDGLHKKLISIGAKPRDIVLDSEDGILFWTDHGTIPAFVRKANMDGSNIENVIRSGLVWPNGLAIDTEANVLYVSDGGTNEIHQCTYQGVTVCTTYYRDNEAHLMDIVLFGDYLYYTAWNRPYVTKLHKTNSNIISRVSYKPELGRLDSLSVYSSTVQPSESAKCSENSGRGPCSTFCLPTRTGYTCSCEDNVSLRSDSKTCENVELPTTPTTPKTTTATSSFSSSTTIETITTPVTDQSTSGTTENPLGFPEAAIGGATVGFVLLIIVIVVLIIVILKRSNNKNNNTGTQPGNQYETGFDISFVTQPAIEPPRPDSTYDFITFDVPEDKTSNNKESNDNIQNDSVSLLRRQKDYEQLSFKKSTQPSKDFRPSAIPNAFQTMADTARPGSTQTLDDYLTPTHTTPNPSTDA